MTERGLRMHGLMAVLVAAVTAAGHAQQPPPQRAEGTVKAGVTAVLVDVVVRDRRGDPVRDLQPSDFEIIEDGVAQTVTSFTPIFDGKINPGAAPPAAAAAAPAATGSEAVVGSPTAQLADAPAVTALVFDRLSPEARRLAVRAAQNYVGSGAEAPGYLGVFGIDLAFTPYASFTRSASVLKKALEQVESHSSSQFGSDREAKASADRQRQTASAAVSAATSAGGPGTAAAVGGSAADAQMAMMQSRMISEFDVLERDQQGYATTNGLFAIINTMRQLPGRKSLVFFSEGVAIPPAVQRLFLGVIDAANRANVSIYTMDAAGLRAESEQAKIRDEVNAAGQRGIGGAYASASGAEPLTKAMEKNEDVLRQDPNTGLGQLARDTGGLLFNNTNNLRQGFDRIESDLRNYYLLGYTPSNDTYDGAFRNIEVKVKRPGLTVAARKGYFAVRDTGGAPVNAWEAPALGAFEQKPVPNAFPVRAAALAFPQPERPGLTPVVVELKTAPLTFAPAADGKTYTSDFAVLVRFRDQQNNVVRKLSQHYEVNGPVADIERAKSGDVIFYREPELDPGLYTMETIVYDAPSGKASVRFSTVEVPKIDPAKLRMSSIILVKRGEKVAADDQREDAPLRVNDTLLYPNLGEPVSKAAEKEVGFYFTAYPAQGAAPEATIVLLQNGKPLAQIPMPLGAADKSGRVQQVGRLPLEALPPGTYELRAQVKQGSDQVARSTMLRVVE
jgi:VWFA-related protein